MQNLTQAETYIRPIKVVVNSTLSKQIFIWLTNT